MGTPSFSVPTLEVLEKSNFNLECVYTQPPNKSSRGQKINLSPVQKFSEKLNIKVRCPRKIDTDEEYNFIKLLDPYIVIVVAYGQIIPKRFLEIPKKGFINIHASLLPKWRGAAPIQRSIINQDKETGISFMKIKEELDSGPYMKQIKIKINEKTTAQKLTEDLSQLGAKNILECVNLIIEEKEKFINQDDDQATYAKKIDKIESKIIWEQSAIKILSKINGLNPSPGAWFEYNGSRLKIWNAEISNLRGEPGKILDNNFTIACKDGSIKILEIQKEGKKKLLINDFIIGTKIIKDLKAS